METIPYPIVHNLILVGIVAMQILAVLLGLSLLNVPGLKKVKKFFSNRALTFSFLIALASVVGSLYYSEIAAFPACILCWWQRVLIYPQVVLFALALWKGKKDVFLYTNSLSVLGIIVAVYNVIIQTVPSDSAFCDIFADTASCTEVYFTGFGYITIPIMSLTALVLLLLIGASTYKKEDTILEI